MMTHLIYKARVKLSFLIAKLVNLVQRIISSCSIALFIKASPYSQNLFDAMYLYGLWINHTRTTGADHRDGRALLKFTDGYAFECKYIQ